MTEGARNTTLGRIATSRPCATVGGKAYQTADANELDGTWRSSARCRSVSPSSQDGAGVTRIQVARATARSSPRGPKITVPA